MRCPPFVGLTGGIGAGKSTRAGGADAARGGVLSTDAVVHELYESDAVRDAVVARFGDEVAPGRRRRPRARSRERAFATAADRGWLEGLLWPLVGERVAAWRADVEPRSPRAASAGRRGAAAVRGRHRRRVRRDDRGRRDEALRTERAAARGHRGARRARGAPAEQAGKGRTVDVRRRQRRRRRSSWRQAVGNS